jgi:CheY-like chemotaxis protein
MSSDHPNPKTLLVIDDEVLIQEVIQACLEDLAGWQVWQASSGEAGLALLQSAPHLPDAILLDVSMPSMDGVATYQQLAAQPATQSIPVILLTAKVQPADRERFAQLGLAGVISKPFEPMGLVNQISSLLGWN